MKVGECGSVEVWEWGSIRGYTPILLYPHTPIPLSLHTPTLIHHLADQGQHVRTLWVCWN